MMRKNKTIKTTLFTLLLFASCFISMSKNEVNAAEDPVKVDDYYVQQYTTEEANSKIGKQSEIPTLAGYLFAGWYEEQACTTPIRETGVTTECYAKFVKESVLSVKCQTAVVSGEGTNDEKSNLRFVSSVDGKNYSKVGFEIVRDGKTYNDETSTTYKRIVANDAAKVAYEYSPQVIDTESSSFITYTITDIPKDAYDMEFYTKPYWKTLDGVKVYGVCRYVTVNDYINDVVNIPVRVAKNENKDAYTFSQFTISENNTAITDTINSAVRYRANADYVSIILTGRTLKSLTKYDVVAGSETTKYLHRNLGTIYAGTTATSDYSWYEVANQFNSNEDEYVIATSADLYGLSYLSSTLKSSNFSEKTIYLVADLVANKGVASNSGLDGDPYTWTSISRSLIDSKYFAGVFDGNSHTIKGLYFKGTSTNNVGLFSQLDENAVIKNLRIENSYFSGNKAVGVIAGQGGKTFSNITVADDVFLISKINMCGGIIGKSTKVTTIENCTVGVTITAGSAAETVNNQSQTVSQAGGLIGVVAQGRTTINNCKFNGNVSGTALEVGGMIGQIQTTATLTNCYVTNSANVTANNGEVGGLIGDITSTSTTPTVLTYCHIAGTVTNNRTSGNARIGGMCGVIGATSIVEIDNCLNVGIIMSTVTTQRGSFIGLKGSSAHVSINNSYGVAVEGVSLVGTVSGEAVSGNTNTSTLALFASSDLMGENAYNTSLEFDDIATDTPIDGHWVITTTYPMLRSFAQ